MNAIETMREFFGWCSVINAGVLLVSVIFVVALRRPVSLIHARMFDLEQHDISRAYFQHLSQYKIAIVVFNVVPYCAFVLMS